MPAWQDGLTDEQIVLVKAHIEEKIKDRFKNNLTVDEGNKLKLELETMTSKLEAARAANEHTSESNKKYETEIASLNVKLKELTTTITDLSEKENESKISKILSTFELSETVGKHIKKLVDVNSETLEEDIKNILTEMGISLKPVPPTGDPNPSGLPEPPNDDDLYKSLGKKFR